MMEAASKLMPIFGILLFVAWSALMMAVGHINGKSRVFKDVDRHGASIDDEMKLVGKIIINKGNKIGNPNSQATKKKDEKFQG